MTSIHEKPLSVKLSPTYVVGVIIGINLRYAYLQLLVSLSRQVEPD